MITFACSRRQSHFRNDEKIAIEQDGFASLSRARSREILRTRGARNRLIVEAIQGQNVRDCSVAFP